MRQLGVGLMRVCALAAFAMSLFGVVASASATAQESGPCQIILGGEVDTTCEVVVDTEDDTCSIVNGGETVQTIESCSAIVQGSCPYQLVAETDDGTLTLQVQCSAAAAGVAPTDVPPTATDVPPTATDVPPTATDVPPTATDVPPTATDVPPTGTVEPTVEPTTADTDTDTETDTATATETATDADTDADTDEVVTALPSTGSGADNAPAGALVVVISSLGVVLAGAAFAWQRRSVA